MHVAHLRPTGAELFAAGLLATFDESCVRGDLLHALKPCHVVNLIEDRHRQDLANAGDRSEAVERIRVVALGIPNEGHLEVVHQPVILVDEREIDVDALAHTRIGNVLADAITVRGLGEPPLEFWEVVLGARVLNVREELTALPHQMKATPQQIPSRPHRRWIDVRLRQQAPA